MKRQSMDRYIGCEFGYLTIIDTFMADTQSGRRRHFKTRCVCGSEKDILSHNILQGSTKSCGCMTSKLKGWNFKHGLHDSRIYQIYYDMRDRCLNPNNPRYHRYGGRGIKICDEWQEDFITFYEWAMSKGYSDSLTIERTDNDGDYTPENCKWATMEEQLKNRDFSRMGGRRKRERTANVC